MANFYADNDDLRYYVERGIDWEPLVRLRERDFNQEGGFSSVEEATAFTEKFWIWWGVSLPMSWTHT